MQKDILHCYYAPLSLCLLNPIQSPKPGIITPSFTHLSVFWVLQQTLPIWSCLSFTLWENDLHNNIAEFHVSHWEVGCFFFISHFLSWILFSWKCTWRGWSCRKNRKKYGFSYSYTILSLWWLECFRGTLIKPQLPHCLLLAVYYGSCKCQAQSLKSWRRHQWAGVWEHIGRLDVGARLLPSWMLLRFFLTFRFF